MKNSWDDYADDIYLRGGPCNNDGCCLLFIIFAVIGFFISLGILLDFTTKKPNEKPVQEHRTNCSCKH